MSRAHSILGLNGRNRDYVRVYNPPRQLALVDDKLQTKDLLAAADIAQPPLLEVIHSNVQLRPPLFQRLLQHRSGFVAKPARGAMGAGVLIIESTAEGALHRSGGRPMPQADFITHCRRIIGGEFSARHEQDRAIIEQRVESEPALTTLSGGGAPDLRVIVFRGRPVMAMLRLPTQDSDGRANLHAGGIGVGIDLETGRCSFAIQHGDFCERHPDTQTPLAGCLIPHWPTVLDICRRLGQAVPLGYFGADIMLDRDHGPLVVELNARPGLSIQLANRCGLRKILEETR